MSEAASSAPDEQSSPSRRSDPDQTADGVTQTCPQCGSILERDHVHSCRCRSQTVFCCPTCRANTAIIELTQGELPPRYATQLERDQRRLQQQLSVETLSAYIDTSLPPGVYRVDRIGPHEYRLVVPKEESPDAIDMLVDRLAVEHIGVEQRGSKAIVFDERFTDEPCGNSGKGDSPDETPPRTDGGGLVRSRSAPLPSRRPLPQTGRQTKSLAYHTGEARTRRARTEEMRVSLLQKGGKYSVRSESGNTYEVDLLAGTCSCPDDVDTCKHLRRVDLELRANRIPRPDGQLPYQNQ
jgi:hypothetical protein